MRSRDKCNQEWRLDKEVLRPSPARRQSKVKDSHLEIFSNQIAEKNYLKILRLADDPTLELVDTYIEPDDEGVLRKFDERKAISYADSGTGEIFSAGNMNIVAPLSVREKHAMPVELRILIEREDYFRPVEPDYQNWRCRIAEPEEQPGAAGGVQLTEQLSPEAIDNWAATMAWCSAK